jgi:hypothetical protein
MLDRWPSRSGVDIRHVFVFSLSLAAHCIGANADNLVANPDFNTDVGSWTWIPNVSGSGSFTLDTTTGDPAAPSAHIVTDAASGGVARSQCILINAPQNLDLIVNGKSNAGGSADVWLMLFTTDDCTFGMGHGASLGYDSGTWEQKSQSNLAISSDVQSVQIWLVASASQDFNIDHVQLGLSGTLPVTLQSFQVD